VVNSRFLGVCGTQTDLGYRHSGGMGEEKQRVVWCARDYIIPPAPVLQWIPSELLQDQCNLSWCVYNICAFIWIFYHIDSQSFITFWPRMWGFDVFLECEWSSPMQNSSACCQGVAMQLFWWLLCGTRCALGPLFNARGLLWCSVTTRAGGK